MAAFLLDTNVVSELIRPVPEERVVRWIAERPATSLHLSAVTLAELVRGVRRLASGRRRTVLERWIAVDLTEKFGERILAFDREAAVIWGELMGDADRRGQPRGAADAQIAAIALRHGLTVTTRNEADFDGLRVRTLNPWNGS